MPVAMVFQPMTATRVTGREPVSEAMPTASVACTTVDRATQAANSRARPGLGAAAVP